MQEQARAPDATSLRRLIMGFRASQMTYVAARLELADHLAAGPQSAEALAKAVGAAPRPLYRLMRALASMGIFVETGEGAFALNAAAELLRGDVPGSLKSTALLYGDAVLWSAYGDMLHSVRTGEPAFERVHGEPLFPYLAGHPDTAALFHDAMREFSEREITAILEAYDFARFSAVVDVGGGHGTLVAALLRRHAHLRGTIVDLETAAEGARRLLTDAGVAARASFVAGDFFSVVPVGGDLYLLKSVIHNWNDAAATAILRNCRQAMRAGGRLLVIERVLPAPNTPSEGTLFDINMLVVVGGEERSEQGYRDLFRPAGFELTQVIPTRSPLSLIEGVAAA